MPATIYCVRHGQGYHNLGAGHYDLRDPDLTPHGQLQCLDLRNASFADQLSISLVVASPLRRTLHSAFTIFEEALKSGGNCHPLILALPDAQETSDDLCDTGCDPSELRQMVIENGWPVDLDLVQDGWNDKSQHSRYSPSAAAIKMRARDVRAILRLKIHELETAGCSDVRIVLVSHGGFLHFFTDDWEDAARYPGTGWTNCEAREYVFEDDVRADSDGEPRLVETMESRNKRGKTGLVHDGKQQRELFRLAMEGWGKQGLQRPDKEGL
jgi:broad specificity phosphatase PhoE